MPHLNHLKQVTSQADRFVMLNNHTDHALVKGFEKWSHRIGLAFQGLHDLSDLMADPLVSGKDPMNDVREGRVSLPLFMLRQSAEPEEWQSVLDIAETREGVLSLPSRRMLLQLMSKYELAPRTLSYAEEQLDWSRRNEMFGEGEGAFESEELYQIARPYMDNIANVLGKELKLYRKRLVVDGLERAIDAESF
jgi:geranylgeranyl pyrophosphate synthase